MMPAQKPAPQTEAPAGVAERVIDAALEEFTEFGIRRVSVDDIAKRAGVHRVTVYKYFKNKDEVVSAAAITWLQRFYTKVAVALADLPNAADRLVEGFALGLFTIRTEPLAIRVVQAEPETTLPFLTTNGGNTIAAMREFIAYQIRAVPGSADDVDVEGVAELVVRTGLSMLLTPESHFDLDDLDSIRVFARKYLAPMLSA